ncbi:hypothetical protein [Thalassomonas sp. M1454]|uniref:hypothetical protein n=1 Tax=Thalassomonas sp. M1454 TaxID=2594477 RepID=UPI00117D59E0|nr:hypothetical protein [Thalassomonas sp. M1454]TRX58071.1 hypothetical protein FNN08_01400 [Thalassomonas sp. M1454]
MKHKETNWKTRTKKNTITLGIWTFSWLVTTAIVAFAPKFIWDFNVPLTIIAVIANIIVGFGMILANRNHLRGLDEMQQKIQSEAMALSLGVGLVLGCSYQLLEDIKLIAFEPEISHLIIVMCIAFMVGVIKGGVKYR